MRVRPDPVDTAQRSRPDPVGVALAVIVICSQRMALPLGGIEVPVSAIAVFVITTALITRGRWVISPVRGILLMAFVALALVTMIVFDEELGPLSALVYVVVLWWPAVATMRGTSRHRHSIPLSFGSALVVTTSIAGLLGAFQSLWSLLTGVFVDPLASLPPELLVPGYKSAQAVQFAGRWMKGNGMVFLEPSFLSLLSAVGLLLLAAGVVRLSQRAVFFCVIALVVGLLSSVAISGVVILPAVLLALLRSARAVLAAAAIGTVLTALVLATPLLSPFTSRLFFRAGSNDARLVRPYEQLLPIWLQEHLLLGSGPGSAGDLARSITADNWQTEVTKPTVVKLMFEYGLLGGACWLALIIAVLIAARTRVAVKLGLAIMLFVPTDGLSSHVIAPCFVFLLMGFVRAVKGRSRVDADPAAHSGERRFADAHAGDRARP